MEMALVEPVNTERISTRSCVDLIEQTTRNTIAEEEKLYKWRRWLEA